MAFFGLTALGPQNSFRASLLDFSYLDVFTEADQDNAFRLVDVDSRGYLDLEQVCPSHHAKTTLASNEMRRGCAVRTAR